jgi:hypothetical protein
MLIKEFIFNIANYRYSFFSGAVADPPCIYFKPYEYSAGLPFHLKKEHGNEVTQV